MGPDFDDVFRADFEALLRWRRDVRRFRSDPVEPQDIETLLGLADLAPSVGNSQPWRFVLVESPDRRACIQANFERANGEALEGYSGERAALYSKLKLAGLRDAPVHIAVFCQPDPDQGRGLGRRTMPETLCYSAVGAIHTLWLAARARGLGFGWVSILDPAPLNAMLDVPADWAFIAYLCLGYAEEEYKDPELERAGWQPRTALSRRVFRR